MKIKNSPENIKSLRQVAKRLFKSNNKYNLGIKSLTHSKDIVAKVSGWKHWSSFSRSPFATGLDYKTLSTGHQDELSLRVTVMSERLSDCLSLNYIESAQIILSLFKFDRWSIDLAFNEREMTFADFGFVLNPEHEKAFKAPVTLLSGLNIITARPGTGKSFVARCIANSDSVSELRFYTIGPILPGFSKDSLQYGYKLGSSIKGREEYIEHVIGSSLRSDADHVMIDEFLFETKFMSGIKHLLHTGTKVTLITQYSEEAIMRVIKADRELLSFISSLTTCDIFDGKFHTSVKTFHDQSSEGTATDSYQSSIVNIV